MVCFKLGFFFIPQNKDFFRVLVVCAELFAVRIAVIALNTLKCDFSLCQVACKPGDMEGDIDKFYEVIII